MLTQLLSFLEEGNSLSITELAQRLHTSEDTVKAQMEYLERLGMLRRITSGGGCAACSGSCGGCRQNAARCPAMWEKVS